MCHVTRQGVCSGHSRGNAVPHVSCLMWARNFGFNVPSDLTRVGRWQGNMCCVRDGCFAVMTCCGGAYHAELQECRMVSRC